MEVEGGLPLAPNGVGSLANYTNRYAFGSEDGVWKIFQAVGLPTSPHCAAPSTAPPARRWSIEPPPAVLWQIGCRDNSEAEFDSDPHDDPVTINYNVGDPFSMFPSQSGTDIGPQRSVINIHFALPAAERARLALRWSPGGTTATERFQVLLDDVLVGLSQVRAGSVPTVWDTESFNLSTLSPGQHVITIVHLQGDGLWWDCLTLERCQAIMTGVDE